MSESDSTGYNDSPDTTDSDIGPGGSQHEGADVPADGGATLTTDDDAQKDDGIVRPGNEAD
ncbi:hypothetical protein FHU33_0389 [Blastococcus colisei]|uniref:Uncharacterized protein n=1 Tax=Blastococcus colisei TaxID=1564162 RepID=A0A543PAC2_9ACTN|nr:hypothetical protein [Blastococcus colisei]TQN41037.1 hypothetical protein FHU33_0389 [Blastococcus colisei]